MGEQTKAQDGLRRRMDKLKNSIEEGNAAVAKERKKNVSLLYLIFPAEIAESLWLGNKKNFTFRLNWRFQVEIKFIYFVHLAQDPQLMPKPIRM